MNATVRVATRPSALALAQTQLAVACLQPFFPGCELRIVPIRSEGDDRAASPLREFGDKAVFVSSLEAALIDGRADIAVHSLKDLPLVVPPRLWVPACLPREDPRDALVSRSGETLAELAAGSRLGTSSLRRREQLRGVRPDLDFVDIRGNVDTRLSKVASAEYDAVVLAAAGLLRLGLRDQITEYLDPGICVPAPGQGIVAIECRENYELGEELLSAGDAQAKLLASAERAVAAAVGATCSTAFGALATIAGDLLSMIAWLQPDGGHARHAHAQGAAAAWKDVATAVADQLLNG